MKTLIEELKEFHKRIEETGGVDWFEDITTYDKTVYYNVSEILEEAGDNPEFFMRLRYNYRPMYCSSVSLDLDEDE